MSLLVKQKWVLFKNELIKKRDGQSLIILIRISQGFFVYIRSILGTTGNL